MSGSYLYHLCNNSVNLKLLKLSLFFKHWEKNILECRAKKLILFWIYCHLNLKAFCTWQYFEIRSKAKAPLSHYFRFKLKFILFFLIFYYLLQQQSTDLGRGVFNVSHLVIASLHTEKNFQWTFEKWFGEKTLVYTIKNVLKYNISIFKNHCLFSS